MGACESKPTPWTVVLVCTSDEWCAWKDKLPIIHVGIPFEGSIGVLNTHIPYTDPNAILPIITFTETMVGSRFSVLFLDPYINVYLNGTVSNKRNKSQSIKQFFQVQNLIKR